jgi:AmmeMemoRadiSam system protein A
MLRLAEAEQQTLLRLAREALAAYLDTSDIPSLPEPEEPFRAPCGVFVSWHKGRNLRGCLGLITADKPLYVAVRECAVWAALEDRRFPPVKKAELSELTLEISVLSPLFDIAPENIEIGTHGLLVSRDNVRGLLLPQVPVQWKWNREQFLEETCRKAGLPSDDWRRGARIQAFTAQIFAEAHRLRSSHPEA